MTATTPRRFGLDTELGNPNLKYPTKFGDREKKLAQSILFNKNIDDTFDRPLVVSNFDNTDGTIYTGATGEILAFWSGVASYQVYQAAVAVAAVIAPHTSAGWLYLTPVAAADALELNNGTSSTSSSAFTVGTSEDFFLESTIYIDDISDVTELWCGFRKAEAHQADPDNYDELACINVGLGADGRFNITKILNNAATSTTNTGVTAWADQETHTLRVVVRKNGRCEFWIDGVQSTSAAHTFDDGEVVVPFLHLDTETGDPDVRLGTWRVGTL